MHKRKERGREIVLIFYSNDSDNILLRKGVCGSMGTSKYIMNQQLSVPKLDARLLYVSNAKYDGEWDCSIHSHYFTEIFYIMKGTVNFIVDNYMITGREHDLLIINPNIEHKEFYSSSLMEYIVFGLDGLSFRLNKEEMISYYLHHPKEDLHSLVYCMKIILEEIENQKPGYELVCQKFIEILLLQLMRKESHHFVAASFISSKKINQECSKVKRFLDSNYFDQITLDTLADLTHMNKYYLTHAFTKYTGVSPIHYLNNCRIEQSKNLLEATDYSVAQIASSLGFSSQAYFSQAFRKYIGSSPNEYRKQAKIRIS